MGLRLKVVWMGWFLAVVSLARAEAVQAGVVINEVSPASEPEWVELYNLGEGETSLFGCRVYFDNSSESQMVEFNATDSAEIGKYLVLRQGETGWTSNWLNNGGDEVRLVCEGFSDSFAYEKSDNQMTWGRYPDGGSISTEMMASSMGAENNQPPTPMATVVPTQPAATQPGGQAATPTPTPVSLLTPKPTVVPTATPKKTLEPSVNEEKEEEVLGLREELKTSEASVSAEESEGEKGKFPVLAGGLIVSGLGFVGVAVYPFVKQGWERYNERKRANEGDENEEGY